MPTGDYYAILGVPKDATQDEIKASFRRLARKYHPDVNKDDPQAEEKFKQIGEAYAVLSDEQKRAQYDRFGTVSDIPNMGFDFATNISDIFDMFFGGGTPRSSGPQPIDGRDIRVDVTVNLKEVITGCTRKLDFSRLELCSECNGTGAAHGAGPVTCSDCGGSGVISQTMNTLMGQIRRTSTCGRCMGSGKVIKEKCKRCSGKMVEKRKTHLEVSIPPGVDYGTMLHIPGQGDEGLYGGRPGDLYVGVKVLDDNRFTRDERGLITHVNLTIPQAVLGVILTLEGVTGEFELEIPPGTQPGQEFRVPGQGVPRLGSKERGDLRVRVSVEIPKKLTDEQKTLMEAFERSISGGASRRKGRGFVEAFKQKLKGDD